MNKPDNIKESKEYYKLCFEIQQNVVNNVYPLLLSYMKFFGEEHKYVSSAGYSVYINIDGTIKFKSVVESLCGHCPVFKYMVEKSDISEYQSYVNDLMGAIDNYKSSKDSMINMLNYTASISAAYTREILFEKTICASKSKTAVARQMMINLDVLTNEMRLLNRRTQDFI